VADRRRQLKWYERPAESFAKSRVGGWYFINVAMRIDRRLLPLTNGRVSSGFGQQVGLLQTTGAKSGEPRAIPLLYLTDGDRIVLIASKGGAPKHPAWLHNIRKHPNVSFLAPRGREQVHLEAPRRSPDALLPDHHRHRLVERAGQDAAVGDVRGPLVVLLEEEAPGHAAGRPLELHLETEQVRAAAAEAELVVSERHARASSWRST